MNTWASQAAQGQRTRYRGHRDAGSPLGWEDPLEKEMATHSMILAWRIPWTEELGGLCDLGGHKESLSTTVTINLKNRKNRMIIKNYQLKLK